MPRAARVPRTCLVCDAQFDGTPASTRCPKCKQEGLRVPPEKQAEQASKRRATPAAPDAVTYERTCFACGQEHITTRPKARRCPSCIEANRKAKSRTCIGCSAEYPAIDTDQNFCPRCIADGMNFEFTEEDEREQRIARRKARVGRRIKGLMDFVERRNRKPKDFPKMTKTTAGSPVGLAWLRLCEFDGALHALQDLRFEEKGRLYRTYADLRLRGFNPNAISQIDPIKLMARDEAEVEQDIESLPEVEEHEDLLTFDPLEDLDAEMRAEVEAFTAEQQRQRDQIRLGLVDPTP